MSLEHISPYFAGIGIALPPAWLVGHTFAEWTIYAVTAVALVFLLASFAIEKYAR